VPSACAPVIGKDNLNILQTHQSHWYTLFSS
jgi:hypothetical protein